MHRFLRTLALAALASLLPLGTLATVPDPGLRSAAPAASPKAPMALGAYLPPPGDAATRIARFRNRTGRVPAIVALYAGWGGDFSQFYEDGIKAYMQGVVEAGATPMLTWEPWAGNARDGRYALRNLITSDFCPNTTSACQGLDDAYVRTFAQEMSDWLEHEESDGATVLIRLAHEMNGGWYSWGKRNGNTPAEYKAFWRYVVSTFREVLAPDVRSRVKWVWAPNNPASSAVKLKDYWPGASWVDYMGFSSYNWGRAVSWGTWKSMYAIYRPSMQQLTAISPTKPVIVSETGSTEKGGDKPAWIRKGYAMLKTTWPRLVAVVWQDSVDPRGYDWRVGSTRASRDAYRKVVAMTFYRGHLPS